MGGMASSCILWHPLNLVILYLSFWGVEMNTVSLDSRLSEEDPVPRYAFQYLNPYRDGLDSTFELTDYRMSDVSLDCYLVE